MVVCWKSGEKQCMEKVRKKYVLQRPLQTKKAFMITILHKAWIACYLWLLVDGQSSAITLFSPQKGKLLVQRAKAKIFLNVATPNNLNRMPGNNLMISSLVVGSFFVVNILK